MCINIFIFYSMWVICALSHLIGLVINRYVIMSKKYSLFSWKKFNNFIHIIWVGIFEKYQIIFQSKNGMVILF